jgi:hypothetical protein
MDLEEFFVIENSPKFRESPEPAIASPNPGVRPPARLGLNVID